MSVPPDELEWMTRAEVAERLGVTVRTVARYIDRGELRAYKRGPRAVRIRRSDVADLFQLMHGGEHSAENH